MGNKLYALFTNRPFMSALLVVAGSVSMLIFGRKLDIDPTVIDSVITIVSLLATVLGWKVALNTPAPPSNKV